MYLYTYIEREIIYIYIYTHTHTHYCIFFWRILKDLPEVAAIAGRNGALLMREALAKTSQAQGLRG